MIRRPRTMSVDRGLLSDRSSTAGTEQGSPSSIRAKGKKGSMEKQVIARSVASSQLADLSRDITKLLDNALMNSTTSDEVYGHLMTEDEARRSVETKILHYKLKGDQHALQSSLVSIDNLDEVEDEELFNQAKELKAIESETALSSYNLALSMAVESLSPASCLRLSLILSFAEFYCTHRNKSLTLALRMLTKGYNNAMNDIQTLKGVHYDDSSRMLQLIRDKITSISMELTYKPEEDGESSSGEDIYEDIPDDEDMANHSAEDRSLRSTVKSSERDSANRRSLKKSVKKVLSPITKLLKSKDLRRDGNSVISEDTDTKALELVKSLMNTGDAVSGFALEDFGDSQTLISALHELFFMYLETPKATGVRVTGDQLRLNQSSSETGTAPTVGDKMLNTEEFLDHANATEPRLSDRALGKLCSDFSIVPVLISEEEINVIFKLASTPDEVPVLSREVSSSWKSDKREEKEEAPGLTYQQFVDCLGRCALLAFCVPPYRTQYPMPRDKMEGFLKDYLQLLDGDAWRNKISYSDAPKTSKLPRNVTGGKSLADKVDFEISPGATALFNEMRFKKPLHDIFTAYCKREASIGKPLFESMERFSEQMNQAAFVKLLRDFDVVPAKLSVKEASSLFDVTIAKEAKDAANNVVKLAPGQVQTIPTRLNYKGFIKGLGRCAVKAYWEDSSTPSHADKVTALFSLMELVNDMWRNKILKTGTPRGATPRATPRDILLKRNNSVSNGLGKGFESLGSTLGTTLGTTASDGALEDVINAKPRAATLFSSLISPKGTSFGGGFM